MKVFFVDDSNIVLDDKLGFFVYGGLIIDAKNISDLVNKMYALRKLKSIPVERPIKWTNDKWKDKGRLDLTLHKNLKEAILDLVSKSSCKIITYLAPQDFYHKYKMSGNWNIKRVIDDRKQSRALEFALNVCLQKFNTYLKEEKDLGLVISDEFGSKHLKQALLKHCSSLYFDGTGKSKLENIVYPVIPIDSEYSPMHHVNDVVLGAIQYSLKEFRYNFLPIIKNNFWAKKVVGGMIIDGYGFNIYPKKPKTIQLKDNINQLSDKFKRQINKRPF